MPKNGIIEINNTSKYYLLMANQIYSTKTHRRTGNLLCSHQLCFSGNKVFKSVM